MNLSGFAEKRKEAKSKAKKQVVGVILSGGQAPGGHNVVSGLYDALKATNKENVLLGFLGGPSGLTDDKFVEITGDFLDKYRKLHFRWHYILRLQRQ